MYKLKIICFRRFVSFSWYIANNNLNIDLKIQPINQLAKSHYLSFHTKISNHSNSLVECLFPYTVDAVTETNFTKRLKICGLGTTFHLNLNC